MVAFGPVRTVEEPPDSWNKMRGSASTGELGSGFDATAARSLQSK
ncbi:hypothetical protein GFS60_04216 [Rhodococcus sp. WAY2]|nr:hypothetical protein GFS60_04216 [Rhodococcus sp. WAY2]